eukprot:gnl/TRDRNA2_/TRDRNA2_187091_c0_seq1.p1 gnl/TRDRNA2_/TRDRNA2_187091_c0~~gnl/TRDRNA2_/TRDRNA2_187091_c0_seq1.p1  ORF type:complete len:560 (+),score=119.67 gnl/TRDRNA2_/TRDRNA2_187091_c0_seq1:127-1680(+)
MEANPASAASTPTPSRAATRSRLPIAGTGGFAWRRPVQTGAGASSSSSISAAQATPEKSPAATYSSWSASIAAGAIASGRPVPKEVQSPPSPAVVRRETCQATNSPLVAEMASRLARVERLNQQQAAKILEQSEEITSLQAENLRLRQSRHSSADDKEEVKALRDECARFRRQVLDMEKFLEDYGLTWVGDAEMDDEADQEDIADATDQIETSDKQKGASEDPVRALDIDVIETMVKTLNSSVEKEGPRVVSSRVGKAVHARLVSEEKPPLPLTFFRDGLKLGEQAFCVYESPTAQQVIRDVLDGYFPYVLKDQYPDGVNLKVVDRTTWAFDDWLANHSQTDRDLADGGDRCAPTFGRMIRPPTSLSASTSGTVSQQPAEVKKQHCQPADASKVERQGAPGPPAAARGHEEVVSLLAVGRPAAASSARVQVKVADGQRICFLMEPSQTIGDLEDAIARWQKEHGVACDSAFYGQRCSQLRTAFPPRAYVDRCQTLADAGLTPSATLFVSSAPSGVSS